MTTYKCQYKNVIKREKIFVKYNMDTSSPIAYTSLSH